MAVAAQVDILQFCNSAILLFCNSAILQFCNSEIIIWLLKIEICATWSAF